MLHTILTWPEINPVSQVAGRSQKMQSKKNAHSTIYLLKSFKTWSIFYFNQSKTRPFPFTKSYITYAKLTSAPLQFCTESSDCIFTAASQEHLLGLWRSLLCACKCAPGSAAWALPSHWSHALRNVCGKADTLENCTLYAFRNTESIIFALRI